MPRQVESDGLPSLPESVELRFPVTGLATIAMHKHHRWPLARPPLVIGDRLTGRDMRHDRSLKTVISREQPASSVTRSCPRRRAVCLEPGCRPAPIALLRRGRRLPPPRMSPTVGASSSVCRLTRGRSLGRISHPRQCRLGRIAHVQRTCLASHRRISPLYRLDDRTDLSDCFLWATRCGQ